MKFSSGLKNKRVLITGGAGFIGSELTRQAVDAGARVLVVDNLVNGSRENLAGISKERVRLITTDIRDTARITQIMKGVEMVYHLACLGVRHSIHAPVENHQVNATGTLGLLLAAKKNKVKRFIYISSSEVYGTATSVPMGEEHPAFPLTVYGSSKLAGECYTRAFNRTYGYPTVVVRPFNSYGPRSHHEGDSGEVIPKFILRSMAGRPMIIFGDGSQTRDFTYVADTARGILLAGLCQAAIGQTINIGQGRETTIKELAKKVAKVLGKTRVKTKHEKSRPGDVLRLYANTTRAGRLLGFKPTVSLEEGLLKLYDWYRSSGKSAEDLLQRERVYNWHRHEI